MSVTEPKQTRSRKTLEQIVAASEALLEVSTFEEISMQAIAEKAGVAIGSLYECVPGVRQQVGRRSSRRVHGAATPRLPSPGYSSDFVARRVRVQPRRASAATREEA